MKVTKINTKVTNSDECEIRPLNIIILTNPHIHSDNSNNISSLFKKYINTSTSILN